MNLRDLQRQQPWAIPYSADFRANPQDHKDFAHAVLHAVKAAGKLAGMCDDLDHGRMELRDRQVMDYVADLVNCALRMANTYPGGMFDLEQAVIERIETKNNVRLIREGHE